MPRPEPRVGTLSDLMRQRRVIWLNCERCRHGSGRIEPAELIARHGDMDVQRFLDRSRCSQCGSRDIGLIAPPGPGTAGVPS